MQSRIEDLRRAGIEFVAISADPLEETRAHAEEERYSFPLLSDADRSAIAAYGALHRDVRPRGDIARPAEFLIDENGKVARRWLPSNLLARLRPEQVLEEVGASR